MPTEVPDASRVQFPTLHLKLSSSDIHHSHQIPVTTRAKPGLSISNKSGCSSFVGSLTVPCFQEASVDSAFSFLGSLTEEGVWEHWCLGLVPWSCLLEYGLQETILYSKALGKDGILVCHEQIAMHHRVEERADLFLQNYRKPDTRVDTQLIKQQQLAEENKEVLRQIVIPVEFLAKQSLPFRSHHDDKVDFSCDDTNRGNLVATLQLLAKENNLLQKHSFMPRKMPSTPARSSRTRSSTSMLLRSERI